MEITPLLNKVRINKAVLIYLTNRSKMIPSYEGILTNLLDVSTEYKTCQTCASSNCLVLLSLRNSTITNA